MLRKWGGGLWVSPANPQITAFEQFKVSSRGLRFLYDKGLETREELAPGSIRREWAAQQESCVCSLDMEPKTVLCVVVVAHSLNCVWCFATPWTAAHQAPLSFTISESLLKSMFFESVMLSHYLILCCSLFFLPSISPSIRVFSSESNLCIRWPKYRGFSFSISPSSEYSGLVSFRIDWFNVLVW